MPDQSEDGFTLSSQVVAIMGMGLMGSSLALASKGHCARVIGFDPDPQVVQVVRERQIVDGIWTDPIGRLAQATMIILAAPVGTIIRLLAQLPELHTGKAVVMDLGSTKREIVSAMKKLPACFTPIGGHPMCGKEQLGPEQADAGLFRGAPFVLCKVNNVSDRAEILARELVSVIGSQPLMLDPEEHDRWVASTSHLPFLVANALAAVTPQESAALARSGWQSTTRLAHTPTSMMLDILRTNRENILEKLQAVQAQLKTFESVLQAEDYTQLERELKQGSRKYIEIQTKGK